jgi:hypothetical protein
MPLKMTRPLCIVSLAVLCVAAAAAIDESTQTAPSLGLWLAVKRQLISEQGENYFASSLKDAEIPGGANGVRYFRGTILIIDRDNGVAKLTLGVEDPNRADAILLFSPANSKRVLSTFKVGQLVEFDGVATSFVKDPFSLTVREAGIHSIEENEKNR